MNYETATDFELNIKLSTLMAWRYEKGIKSVQYEERQNYLWIENVGFQSFPISEYCTNWNDIMPIAVELGVDLILNWKCKGKWSAEKRDIGYTCNSPQRALVICCIEVLSKD